MVPTCGARSVKATIAGSADQWYGTSSCLAVVVSSAQEYVVTALRLHVVLCTDSGAPVTVMRTARRVVTVVQHVQHAKQGALHKNKNVHMPLVSLNSGNKTLN